MTNPVLAALDPAQILRAAGLAPDPWQQHLMQSDDRQVLLNCSRQSGKSTTVAALALHAALYQPGSLTLLLSPSLRQSVELFRKVLACYRALGRPLRAVTDSQTGMELVNQSRIVCLPGKEETIRSFSGVGLLIVDEAARVPDDLYRSVRPMLAVSRGRLVCLSTPFGRRGFFYREWHDADAPWRRVRITWKDCPRITADFIAGELRSLGESWVRQEYECSFEAFEGLVYPDFDARCGVDECPHTVASVGGLDFGYRNPFAALWGRVDHDGVLWLFGERYGRGQAIHEHAVHLPDRVLWHADPAGAQEIATLQKMGFSVRRGHNDIAPGIAAIRARIETGRLKVLRKACPNLLDEARLYRYPTASDGEAQSEVPVDEHNHALAALRYLVSRTDDSFLRNLRKAGPAGRQSEPALRWRDESLWIPLR